MVLSTLAFLTWFVHVNANHCHKFTKWKFEDTKCKHGLPYWIWIPSFVLQLETPVKVMEVDKQLKFKSHQWTGLEKVLISPWLVTLLHICGVIPTPQSPILPVTPSDRRRLRAERRRFRIERRRLRIEWPPRDFRRRCPKRRRFHIEHRRLQCFPHRAPTSPMF